MEPIELKDYWEQIYETKKPEERSWTQNVPQRSLETITSLNLSKDAKIIDIGGGDSTLPDHLLNLGYQNITVLDISEKAIETAKKRLGNDAHKINWIVEDITQFIPATTYDLWHDRAVFHFLTEEEHIKHYLNIAEKAVKKFMIISTFSVDGPTKCSGLPIKQYSESTLEHLLTPHFLKINACDYNHITPFNTQQNFISCTFKTACSS